MFFIKTNFFIPKGYRGLAFFPFVFFKYKSDKKNQVFINHEKIHLKQQLELLLVFFYIWYFLEFFLRWYRSRDIEFAYRNISFEREAYANEMNLEYLKKRQFWAFWKYK